MSTLTVTAKGQVTFRKDVLKHLGVEPGDKIVVDKRAGGAIEVRAAQRTGKISDVFGLLRAKKGKRLSIDEINALSAKGWAGRK